MVVPMLSGVSFVAHQHLSLLHEGTAVAPRALPSAFRVHEGVFGCMYVCPCGVGSDCLGLHGLLDGWLDVLACA